MYAGEMIVLAGFVKKHEMSSQIYAYSQNANSVYFNANIFGDHKVNIVNMAVKQYAHNQLLFTSSSDNAVRVSGEAEGGGGRLAD